MQNMLFTLLVAIARNARLQSFQEGKIEIISIFTLIYKVFVHNFLFDILLAM